MILALVTFAPHRREAMSARARLELYERTAPRYQKIPGLIRKYYIGEPGQRAGGAYEWETMADAKAYYTPEWEKFMTENYGSDLRVVYFDAPCVIDNRAGTIIMAPDLVAAAKHQAAE
ncbi:MAG: hypothetical protein SFV19_14600 [Rhodospirillaceae bacterium]|nr:hypothetical protein [Rhodospirillaceae bacterium]